MGEQDIRTERRFERFGGETLLGLTKRPFVQVLLLVTAVAQVLSVTAVASESNVEGQEPKAARAEATSVQLAAVAPVDPQVQNAWRGRALEREVERLTSEYRAKGYNVSTQLGMQIGKAAAAFEIDPEIAFGLVRAESSFRNTATSSVGAVGLTQLMPRTAAWMEPGVTRSQLRDPETNLRVGFKYLRYLLDKYEGDETLALLAYNRGPGTVDKALKRGRSPDNGYAAFVRGEQNHGHRLFTR